MRKMGKILVIIAEILILTAVVILLICTGKNVEEFNSAKVNYYDEKDGQVVYKLCSTGRTVFMIFEENSVKIINSYKFSSKKEIYELAKFIKAYMRKQGEIFTRSNTATVGEMTLHNVLYELGYRRENVASADIDYEKDPRWYVNLTSAVLGLF